MLDSDNDGGNQSDNNMDQLIRDFENSNRPKRSKMKKTNKSGGFQSMGLSYTVLKGVLKRGYKVPTPIQRKAIPMILKGKDIVAMARTGSGKTATFLIPMFEKLKGHDPSSGARALILSPTRELALQTLKFTKQLSCFTDLIATAVLGGEKIEEQFSNLHAHPDIIIATPGRFMHICIEMNLKLNDVKYLVFDEADRLFEMGFQEQLRDIIKRIPEQRQTLLFSATLSKILAEFAKAGLYQPELIRLDVEMKLNDNLTLAFFHLRHDDKTALLLYLLRSIIPREQQVVVFVATRHHCEYLKELLEQQQQTELFSCVTIYSTLDHELRKINISKYQEGRTRVMVVTDIAARGLDIPCLDNVVNYHFPSTAKLFVHRVGRVARAGRFGTAYSFVSTDELSYLFDLQSFIGKSLHITQDTDDVNGDWHLVFGNVPQTIIDEELETIKRLSETSVDLMNLFKVQQNAYQHYIRSRPVSSTESIKQLREFNAKLLTMAIHPIFRQSGFTDQINPNTLAAQLKHFRAKNTIFEVNPSPGNTACAVMKRKRLRDEKRILKHDQQLADKTNENIQKNDENETSKTVQMDNMTITIQANEADDYESEFSPKKKKYCRREINKDYFIPYQPPDFSKERGLEIQSFERQANQVVMDINNDDGVEIRHQMQKTKWDRKKKKFVNVVDSETKGKKIKTESGQWIRASYKSDVYKKWLDKSKFIDKDGNQNDKNHSDKNHRNRQQRPFSQNRHEESTAEAKPRQFQQRVKQLMNKQKGENGKEQKYPRRSELKRPDQILKKRNEKRKKDSLQRARQMKKAGRTNYKNKKRGGATKGATKGGGNMKMKRTKQR